MPAETEYVAQGSFANCSISGFKRYVVNGVLDVETVKKDWALNDDQIPHLEIELRAAGYMTEPKPDDTPTQSLRFRREKIDEPPPVTE